MSKQTIQNPKSKIQNPKVSPARLAAFEILLKIEREKAFSSFLLPQAEEKLSPPDRALCHQITLGVLRRRIYLDRIVQSFSKTKIEKFDLEILMSLRIGLFQLLFLDKIPDFSAINESVNLVRLAKKRSATGLVNAVLRRATREKEFKFEYADEIERVSVETSHPRRLIEHWAKSFGFEETEKLAQANNETPPLSFRLTNKSDERTIETLRKLGLEITGSDVAAGAFRVAKPNEMLFVYAAEGKIYFQEESSQLVGETVKLREGENFLDVCAAPGSKFTQIKSKLRITNYELRDEENSKFKIADERVKITSQSIAVAGDLHEHRLRFLRDSAQKQGLSELNLIAYDAEKELPFASEAFDCVLLDAPCSGTGTIRHNPEIRYFLTEKDFSDLQAKQLEILQNASKVLKKNGRIVYSTCSLEREENEAVIERFLESNPEFERVSPDLPKRFLTAENFARTNPSRDSTDGFFIAVLKKK
ncbi:MAG TPA: 16S rRNA (cytosine(967)-C(5))-methyltransferase RsmB [Pyrinomonadaceae bacterium]|nr:16S rRNA (cytosine(967)-C(5))-methyltransferase RsmB [Pyrinomonadaceae bacterium]